MKNILILGFCLPCFGLASSGCKKLVDIESPITSISSKNVYNNNLTAVGTITSIYVKLGEAGINAPGELSSLSCIAGLSADEIDFQSSLGIVSLDAYYKNTLSSLTQGGDYWRTTYQRIYVVNSALEGLTASTTLDPSVKKQLLGEARFMRAFYFFYLVNLYGDVPLVLNTDYTINALVKKTPKENIYEQIISDLKIAQNLLSNNYLKGDLISSYPIGSEERVRPTKWAATALLARTYLYNSDWANAEIQAGQVLANNGLYNLESVNNVFVKNSREAIWQLQPTMTGFNAQDANLFILSDTGPSILNPVYLNPDFVKNFEVNDQRRLNWVGSVNSDGINYYYPNKYKIVRSSLLDAPITEYSTVLRLAEQFLIRAEARNKLGNLAGAISDVDEIRKRAGLESIRNVNPNVNIEGMADVISNERKMELFAEWGHRWLDLKRTKTVDVIMKSATPRKGNISGWKSYQQYYPIPSGELQANPNLIQILGY